MKKIIQYQLIFNEMNGRTETIKSGEATTMEEVFALLKNANANRGRSYLAERINYEYELQEI